MQEPWDKDVKDSAASSSSRDQGPKIAAVVFFSVMVAGLIYAFNERARATRLAGDYAIMSDNLKATQNQLAALANRARTLSASAPSGQPTAGTSGEARPKVRQHQGRATARTQRHADDPRWKTVEARLAEHQKEIEQAQKDLAGTRSDLESKLGSTRDELNGAIARNHDEVVALQKRGERLFYEYDLAKSKRFNRVGPISISLRKANPKRDYVDLVLLVDDREITRKHVNLYEPVMFLPADYAQPLEVVVFNIDKNEASGYVSAPKYAESMLAASAAASAAPESAPNPPAPASTREVQQRPAAPLH